MERYFNTTGACNPRRHYMVDIQQRLGEIRKLVERGECFTINRARQYGKTTTIQALSGYLAEDYIVLSLDFQMIGNAKFAAEHSFSKAFANCLKRAVTNHNAPISGLDNAIIEEMTDTAKTDPSFALDDMFPLLSSLCDTAEKPVVLIIDEVDSAANNQVFLDFLAQLRAYYLKREELPAFQSVILAGVYDVKNSRQKLRPDGEHKVGSSWSIAADFDVNMSFSKNGIAGMLQDYESDHHTGMDTEEIAGLISDYTSGYPFLVSRLCKLMDEKVADSEDFPDKAAAWTKDGFVEAVKLLLSEKNTLFESLMGMLRDYPILEKKLYSILFSGKRFVFNPDDSALDIARMFGFIKGIDGSASISNRIFETRLYNYFLITDEAQDSRIFTGASDNKNQFIRGGHLDMELLLKKFVEHFDSIYGDHPAEFDEEEGRRRFLLYLWPIINGAGNYYIEAQTRNTRRMDVVVDYCGEQFIIELKLWRGNAYNERGEQQLSDYLDYFRLEKGYMLSYNFNWKKIPGVKTLTVGERLLVETVV